MTDEEALAALKAAVTKPGRFRLDDEAVISQVLRSYEGMRERLQRIKAATAPGQQLDISAAIDVICEIWNDARKALQSEAL